MICESADGKWLPWVVTISKIWWEECEIFDNTLIVHSSSQLLS